MRVVIGVSGEQEKTFQMTLVLQYGTFQEHLKKTSPLEFEYP